MQGISFWSSDQSDLSDLSAKKIPLRKGGFFVNSGIAGSQSSLNYRHTRRNGINIYRRCSGDKTICADNTGYVIMYAYT